MATVEGTEDVVGDFEQDSQSIFLSKELFFVLFVRISRTTLNKACVCIHVKDHVLNQWTSDAQ